MRTIVLLSVLASAAPAADIPQGTHVLLRMENSVNTRTAKEGDFVYLRTAVPIANSGESLISSEVMRPRRSLYHRSEARKLETLSTTCPSRTTLAGPVGENEEYVARAMRNITPYLRQGLAVG